MDTRHEQMRRAAADEGMADVFDALFNNPTHRGLADVFALTPENRAAYLMALDEFGIYAQRRALNQAGIATTVWRGDEWWH